MMPPVGRPPVALHLPPEAAAPAHVVLYAPNAMHPASGSMVAPGIMQTESLYATIPLLSHATPEGASQLHAVHPRVSSACAKYGVPPSPPASAPAGLEGACLNPYAEGQRTFPGWATQRIGGGALESELGTQACPDGHAPSSTDGAGAQRWALDVHASGGSDVVARGAHAPPSAHDEPIEKWGVAPQPVALSAVHVDPIGVGEAQGIVHARSRK